jgi:outer membrane receptor protein involved in Fe transport
LATTSAIALTLGGAEASAQTTPPAPAPATPSATSVGEVVVTASKRSEKLQNVASAVAVVSSQTLNNLGVGDFHDLASLVPGVSQRAWGAPGLGTIILRGLSTGAAQTTNTAAFYIDDTPFTTSAFAGAGGRETPYIDTADIERVEVLEGPQGTLYGASSLGGIIQVITKKPNLNQYSGNASVEFDDVDGGGQGGLIRGSVNLPIVQDQLAVMITGYGRQSPGYVDNVETHTNNVNWSDLGGGRVALRWKPTDKLTIDVSELDQAIYNNANAFVTFKPGTLTPEYGNNTFANFRNFGSEAHYDLSNVTVAYDAGIGTVTASLSQGDYHVKYADDVTSQYVPLTDASAAGKAYVLSAFGEPMSVVLPANSLAMYQLKTNVAKTTADVKFVSKRFLDDRVEFIAGTYYTHELYNAGSVTEGYTPTGVLLPHPLMIQQYNTSDYSEIAGYGNVTVYLLPNLDLTGGIRYSDDSEHIVTLGPNSILYYAPNPGGPFNDNSKPLTYLATLRWRITSDLSAYLRYATGFRPGGVQTLAGTALPPGTPTNILPDTTSNYEAGVKGTFWDGKLSIDTSVYHIDWNNVQLAASIGGVLVQGNGGQAQVDGAQFQTQLRPLQGLAITGEVGFNDARITAINAATSASLHAFDGDLLPLTPKYTASLSADQTIPLSEGYDGLLGATLRYTSANPANWLAITPVPQQYLPAYTTLDLRAGVLFGKYSVQFRIENVTNAIGYTTDMTPLTVLGQGVVIRPRMYALNFSANF